MKSKMCRTVALALFALAAAAGWSRVSAQVVINEIHYNPPGTDGTVLLEFIELHNRGASAVDISNWRLIFGALPYVFPSSVSIPAGGYVVVAENPASLNAAKGFLTPYSWAGLGVGLDNGGELITLQNAAASDQDLVNYDDVAPWPAGAGPGQPDDGGSSIELINPALDNSLGGSWRASTVVNGTPGAQNSVYSNAPSVQSESPSRRTAVASLATVTVTFNTSVTGVAASNLTVGGSPATSLSCPSCVAGAGAGPYTFSGYATPAPGSATVALAAGSILAGAVPFGGDSWTVSTGIVAVINELHYHPFDVDADAEFLEVYNPGGLAIDMSNWTFSAGLTGTIPPGTNVAAGGYVVFAKVPSLVQARTGYAGAIAWTSGSLSNGGEPVAISDAVGNVIDAITYSDSGTWPTPPDGDGPSAELINPAMPNQFGGAWRPSVAAWGTPGAVNSTFIAAPPPIINDAKHTPLLPLPNQTVTVSALVLDDGVVPPTVTLYYRQDFDPTIAYNSTPMLDDGLHGDGAAGDNVFGATMPGLPDGARLDFTIRADDGTGVSAGPPGNNTLVAGQNPSQTYLCKFSNPPATTDLPHYHLITTQHTRTLQDAHNENEYDGTFVHCNAGSSGCVLFYNVVERYRGQSSLNQHPHGFRVNFPASNPLQSEMGFPIKKLNTMSQFPERQSLGYQFFREAFGRAIPTLASQFIRLETDPLSHGGVQDYAYNNVEAEDADFTESEGGAISPLRWPNMCTISLATCTADADCGALGGTCFDRTAGNLYKGVLSADLQYLGTDENSYRTPYEKQTNETDDIFTDVMALAFALDPDTTSDANFESAVNAVIDENEWARYFAIQMLLVNQEGGIYRDTGDDFLLYMEPPGSPLGYNAKLMARDMDSVFGGFGSFNQETIWRTNIQTPQRFIRNNAYAGRFVGAICDLLATDFTQPVMDARIDALPPGLANASLKAQYKAWVAARIVYVNNEITRTTTLTGVPASPYQAASPTISLSGQLNQCGTYRPLLNGAPVANYSVFNHTWSASYTLVPGPNQITIQSVDVNGAVLDQATANVVYDPPVAPTNSLRLVMPRRMINDKTLTLRADILDGAGRIDTSGCFGTLGTVTMTRISDSASIPITVTFFDNHLPVPDDSIRFYHGVGSVSFTLDSGAAVPAGDYRVTVTVGTLTASKLVTVVANPTWRVMPAVLSGADLVWGPDENIRISLHDTEIPSGSTLTIHPGTLVMVDTTGGLENGTLITVNGQITSVGTADRPVHFFSERGALAMIHTVSGSLSNGDAWRGLYHHGSGSSTYKWTILTGAGNGEVTSHPRPPIIALLNTHNLLVEDSIFVDNTGMMIQSQSGAVGTYTIRRSVISRVGIGAEFIQGGHTLLIEDTWWTGIGRGPTTPQRYDGDGIHIDGSGSSQMLRGIVIADIGDDGIDHSNSNFTVENSIIHDVSDKAMSMTGGLATVRNTLIFNSGTGIRGTAQVYNSTITPSGPIATPQVVQESIIWSSSIPTCSGNINYTIVGSAGDLGCGTGNQSVNPNFANTAQCDYRPTAGSPALTAGPTGGRIGWLGFPTATACTSNAQCNDGNACTIDTCGSLGVCDFRPIAGCRTCATSSDCSDGNACTTDTCGSLGTCEASQPASCDDANACTTDSCDTLLGCQHTAANCDDSNVCTNDSCVGGACQHANNTASCNDANLCTTGDVCGAGVCGGTPVSCPGSSTCSPATGLCVSGPVTVSFQDGVSGYTGTQDTYLAEASPTTVEGTLDNWRWDTVNPNQEFGLIRFDAIFGSGAGQIPAGAAISSATLTLEVTNGSVAPNGNINESTVDWAEATATWNNFGGEAGVQADEYLASPAYVAPIATGTVDVTVTSSVQAWSSALRSNFGWVFRPASDDGMQVDSAEFATVAQRPKLTVVYFPAAGGCVTNGDCSDNNLCNGIETCVATVCQPGTAPNCDDANVCTTDSCNATLGCQHANNTAACSDGNACTTSDTCAAGACVGGPAPNCDDANVCTTDSCNTVSGCVHANNTASCADALFCNGVEVCAGGTCQAGTAVNCDDGVACTGDSCNEATDTCDHTSCAMTVAAAGSRWLDVTPPTGLSSVALKVSAAGFGCLPKYVDATGALTSSPVFRSSAQWGTMKVGDRPIVPGTAYTVQAEVVPGTPIGAGAATTWAWGDANNSGGVSVFDIVCALDGFQSIFTHCTSYGVDQNGAAVAHPVTIDLNDVIAVLDAFSGTPYPDATPCAGLFAGKAGGTEKRDGSEPQGVLTLVPSATTVSRLGTVRIDVFGDRMTDIRGYQVALEAKGGAAGALVPAEALVDAERDDRVFNGRSAFPVTDARGIRLGATLWRDSVTTTDRVYLGSFVFRADGDATGTFHVTFRKSETLFWGASTTSVEAGTSPGVDITVIPDLGPRAPSGARKSEAR
jgi:hypothetical protein